MMMPRIAKRMSVVAALVALVAVAAPVVVPVLLAQAPSMSPADAWAALKAHAQMMDEFHNQHYNDAMQLVQIMRSAGPATESQATQFMNVATLIRGDHRNAGQQLISSTGNTIRVSNDAVRELRGLRTEFQDAARQMQRDPTPQAMTAFRNYVARFGGKLDELASGQFARTAASADRFAAQCPAHGNVAAQFAGPATQAVNTLYGAPKYANDKAKGLRQQQSVFAFFTRWDGQQQRVLAASNVLKFDWRRIEADTRNLVGFIRAPAFLDSLPKANVREVMERIDTLDVYLRTYR